MSVRGGVQASARRFGAVAGAVALTLVLAACGGLGSALAPAPSATFDLTAPRMPPRAGQPRGTLIVQEPSALRPFDTDRIVVKQRGNEIAYLGGALWADRLPRLVQVRLVQTFENARLLSRVGRPGEGLDAATQLVSEIRAFEIDVSGATIARVEITARLVGARTGRVTAAEVFRAEVPAAGTEGAQAAAALDRALTEVMQRIVAWAGRAG